MTLENRQATIDSWNRVCLRRSRSVIGSPIEWVVPTFEDLAYSADPVTQILAEETVSLFVANPGWVIVRNLLQPTPSVAAMFSTPRDRLEFVVHKLIERETLETRMRQKYGRTTTMVRIGNLKPFDLALSNELEDGQFYFSFRDHETNYENALIAVTLIDRKRVQIGTLQHHLSDKDSHSPDQDRARTILLDGEHDLKTHAAQRNHKLRRYIRTHGGTAENPTTLPVNTNTPGVEEALTASVLKMLIDLDMIDKDAEVVIPLPEYTYWGRGHGLGIEYAIWKSSAQALSSVNPDILIELDSFASTEDEIYSRSKTADYRNLGKSLYSLITTSLLNGRQILHLDILGESLPLYFLRLLAQDIADPLVRRRFTDSLPDVLASDYFEAYKFFVDTAENIVRQTQSYRRQFYAYFATFASLSNAVHPEGRAVKIEDVLQTEYAGSIEIG